MLSDQEIREEAWRQAEETLYCSREEFLRELEKYELIKMHVGGQPAFVMFQRGPLIHLMSLRTGHRFPLKEFKFHLDVVIDHHGHVETRTPRHEVQQQRLNEWYGFRRVGEDQFDVHYRMEK